MDDLLIEIGCEPIPHQYVKSAAGQFKAGIIQILQENKIVFAKTELYYTPRRLSIFVTDLPKKQENFKSKIQGPPKKLAFDSSGKPTKTLKGFLKSKGLSLKDTSVQKTNKGRYVFVTVDIKGRTLKEILSEHVPKVLQGIEFPKTMVWNDSMVSFIRPIRWICAIVGNTACPFRFAGLKSSRKTMTNLTSHKKQIIVSSPGAYKGVLGRYRIIVDPKERFKIIKTSIKEKAKSLSAKPSIDDHFLYKITNMIERPGIAIGSFDKEVLDLPVSVLERVIRDIQYCIPLERNRKLINRYLIILDVEKQAVKYVVKGYDQVIKARVSDARFYYENDLKIGLERMVEMENDVVWIEGKGTLREKTDRLVEIASWIGTKLSVEIDPIKRASFLAKADLVSNLIREKDFTPLQGIAGSFYAARFGEDKEVVQAIGEQYLPNYIGDQLPETITGSILSVADRIDNIAAAFAIGKIPSGSQDPLAVRKQAYGLIQIMAAQKFTISFPELIAFIKGFYPDNKDADLLEFFRERLKRYLLDQNISYDIVDAVTSVCLEPYDAVLRCQALVDLRKRKEFEIVVISQKRVANILKGVKKIERPDPEMFKDKMENKIYELTTLTERQIVKPLSNRDYPTVLKKLLNLRNTIDAFFDEVLVMHDDEPVRENRLALVNYIRTIFNKFANFSKIVISGVDDVKG